MKRFLQMLFGRRPTLSSRSPRRSRLTLEHLSQRIVPTITPLFDPSTGVLTISSGSSGETITVKAGRSGIITVNSVAIGPRVADVSQIVVHGNGGDDDVDLSGLLGFAGATSLYGGDGQDVIVGSNGPDRIYGGAHDDTLHGQGGDDTIYGGGGRDHLYGDLGNDFLYFNGSDFTLDGGGDNDTLGPENFLFDGRRNFLVTGVNAGWVEGGGFSSVENLNGGWGGDVFGISPYAGRLDGVINGYGGRDVLDYSGFSTGVTVDLMAGTASSVGGVSKIEIVLGGLGADFLYGNDADNVLVGNGGQDRLEGRGGNDVLIGGTGADHLDGGSGEDVLIGARTSFDYNEEALWQIQKIWSAPEPYATRVANLLASSTPLDAMHVMDDAAGDTLVGGETSNNWFIAASPDVVA